MDAYWLDYLILLSLVLEIITDLSVCTGSFTVGKDIVFGFSIFLLNQPNPVRLPFVKGY